MKEINDLKDRINSIERDKKDYISRLSMMDTYIKATEEQLKNIKSKTSSIQEEAAAARFSLKDLGKEHTIHKAKLNMLIHEKREINTSNDNSIKNSQKDKNETLLVNQKINALEERLDATGKNRASSEEVRELKNEIAELKKQIFAHKRNSPDYRTPEHSRGSRGYSYNSSSQQSLRRQNRRNNYRYDQDRHRPWNARNGHRGHRGGSHLVNQKYQRGYHNRI